MLSAFYKKCTKSTHNIEGMFGSSVGRYFRKWDFSVTIAVNMNFAFFWDTTPDILATIYQFLEENNFQQKKKKTEIFRLVNFHQTTRSYILQDTNLHHPSACFMCRSTGWNCIKFDTENTH